MTQGAPLAFDAMVEDLDKLSEMLRLELAAIRVGNVKLIKSDMKLYGVIQRLTTVQHKIAAITQEG